MVSLIDERRSFLGREVINHLESLPVTRHEGRTTEELGVLSQIVFHGECFGSGRGLLARVALSSGKYQYAASP